jgi:nifR3 family TIM-barrel protein
MQGNDVYYCEFVNVKGLIYQNPKTLRELEYSARQRPIVAQLFGSDPEDFYKAAQIIVEIGFDAIDINMGCPSKKVASKGGGCALMDNVDNAQKIVSRSIEGANEVWKKHNKGEYEVSTKMRLGVHSKDTIYDYASKMVEAGSKVLSIHGRTLKQMYTGNADWQPIGEIVRMLGEKVYIFGSGDVKTPEQALENLLKYKVDGIMIGRGSFGNPWIFSKSVTDRIKHLAKELDYDSFLELKKQGGVINEINPTLEEICDMAYKHSLYSQQDKADTGIVQMRKHLGWYFTNFDGAKKVRAELVRVESISQIGDIFNRLLGYEKYTSN